MSKELLDFMTWVNQDKKLGYTSIGIERIINTYTNPKEKQKMMNKEDTYSIPIYENGVKTEWSVDGIIGDEKYFKLLEFSNGKDLPDMINTTTKK